MESYRRLRIRNSWVQKRKSNIIFWLSFRNKQRISFKNVWVSFSHWCKGRILRWGLMSFKKNSMNMNIKLIKSKNKRKSKLTMITRTQRDNTIILLDRHLMKLKKKEAANTTLKIRKIKPADNSSLKWVKYLKAKTKKKD